MSQDEASAYQTQLNLQTQTGRLLADTLETMKYFCRSMPLDWMLGATSGTNGNTNGVNSNTNQLDFVAALLHLLREPTANIQVLAVDCLEQLAIRGKLEFKQWLRFISDLPPAISEANQIFQVEFNEHLAVERAVRNGTGQVSQPNPNEALTMQLEFHRGLSRLLASMLSSYISHISNDKQILGGSGLHYDKLYSFLRLAVDMLHHPSGRIASEQVNTWIALLRDPQIVKSKILRPFTDEIMSCYMDRMTRIRWEDVENQVHPQTSLMETSWDDQDEYDAWLSDLRSKTSLLFKFLGNGDPQVASATITARVKNALLAHGNGEPINHVDPSNNQLTPKSDAVMFFEAMCQPLDNTLSGLPTFSLSENSGKSDQESVMVSILNNFRTEVNDSYEVRLTYSSLCYQ